MERSQPSSGRSATPADIIRNGRPTSIGTGGRHQSECPADIIGIRNLPNVIGSPHNSAGGGAWRDEYLRRAVQNCRRALLGETPRNLIGVDERML
jgi:hypothetical protein